MIKVNNKIIDSFYNQTKTRNKNNVQFAYILNEKGTVDF